MGMRAGIEADAFVERWEGCLLGWFASAGLDAGEAAELAREVLVQAPVGDGRGDGAGELEAQGERLRSLAEQAFEAWARARRRRRTAPDADGDAQDAGPSGILAGLELLPRHLSAPLYMAHLGGARAPETAAFLGVEESTLAEQVEQGLRELRELRTGDVAEASGPAGDRSAPLDAGSLREALAPSRIDSDAFLRSVQERFDAELADPARSPSRFVRGVARLLPSRSLRVELVGPFAPAGAAPHIGSLLEVLLLAPIHAHLGLAARLAGLTGLLRARDLDPGARSGEYAPTWWPDSIGTRSYRAPVVFLAVIVCWNLLPGTTLTLLAASTLLLAIGLARRGSGVTLPLGALFGALLLAMALLAFQLGPTFLGAHLARYLPALWSAGALLCAAPSIVARRGPAADARPTRAVVLTILTAIACIWLGALAVQRPAGRERLVRYVEEFDPSPPGTHGPDWALVAEHLARDGGAAPDWDVLAARLHRHLDAGDELDLHLSFRAARLGLLRESDWTALDDPVRVEQMLGGGGPIPVLETAAFPILARHVLGSLRPAQREHLVQRTAATLTAEGATVTLARSLLVVELLESLEAPDAVADLTDPLHALLATHWQGSLHDRPRAPFAAVPGPDGPFEGSSFGTVHVRPTAEALALIARAGIPPEIEAWRVRVFLEQHSRHRFLPFAGGDTHFVAAAALRTLERAAPATPLGRSYRNSLARALAPATLLVLASLLATALAERRAPPRGHAGPI